MYLPFHRPYLGTISTSHSDLQILIAIRILYCKLSCNHVQNAVYGATDNNLSCRYNDSQKSGSLIRLKLFLNEAVDV